MLWNEWNFGKISSNFEQNYLKIHDTFVWTYIYLIWSSWSEENDSVIVEIQKCLIKVSLKVHRFHFSVFPRTGEKGRKGLMSYIIQTFCARANYAQGWGPRFDATYMGLSKSLLHVETLHFTTAALR